MNEARFKIGDQNAIYFLTFTVVHHINLFTRKEYCLILVDALNYCIAYKGLDVFSYVIMSNQVHLLCRVNAPNRISDVLRDMKKFSSKKFIKEMNEISENRKHWLLNKFSFEAHSTRRAEQYKVWKDDSYAMEIEDEIEIKKTIEYIHNKPVKAMLVENAEDYIFSSARDYADSKGYVEITKY